MSSSLILLVSVAGPKELEEALTLLVANIALLPSIMTIVILYCRLNVWDEVSASQAKLEDVEREARELEYQHRQQMWKLPRVRFYVASLFLAMRLQQQAIDPKGKQKPYVLPETRHQLLQEMFCGYEAHNGQRVTLLGHLAFHPSAFSSTTENEGIGASPSSSSSSLSSSALLFDIQQPITSSVMAHKDTALTNVACDIDDNHVFVSCLLLPRTQRCEQSSDPDP